MTQPMRAAWRTLGWYLRRRAPAIPQRSENSTNLRTRDPGTNRGRDGSRDQRVLTQMRTMRGLPVQDGVLGRRGR